MRQTLSLETSARSPLATSVAWGVQRRQLFLAPALALPAVPQTSVSLASALSLEHPHVLQTMAFGQDYRAVVSASWAWARFQLGIPKPWSSSVASEPALKVANRLKDFLILLVQTNVATNWFVPVNEFI